MLDATGGCGAGLLWGVSVESRFRRNDGLGWWLRGISVATQKKLKQKFFGSFFKKEHLSLPCLSLMLHMLARRCSSAASRHMNLQ